jgi:holin-like protein
VLAAMFKTAGAPDPNLSRIFDGIAPHVPLLFVPAAVGVVAHLESVSSFWPHFAAAILIGTAATLVVTGLCATAVLRLLRGAPTS